MTDPACSAVGADRQAGKLALSYRAERRFVMAVVVVVDVEKIAADAVVVAVVVAIAVVVAVAVEVVVAVVVVLDRLFRERVTLARSEGGTKAYGASWQTKN